MLKGGNQARLARTQTQASNGGTSERHRERERKKEPPITPDIQPAMLATSDLSMFQEDNNFRRLQTRTHATKIGTLNHTEMQTQLNVERRAIFMR